MTHVLGKDFFRQDSLALAPQLLGLKLVHGKCAGRIIEVEAYLGEDDPASHAWRGPTPRTEIMYEAGGLAYVYFTYGAHFCVNVVAGKKGHAGAVLIRALDPTDGLQLMRHRRGREKVTDLCSGPGKLCQALDIRREQNGLDLIKSKLRIESGDGFENVPKKLIASGPRIGISRAKTRPWRFWIKDHPGISVGG